MASANSNDDLNKPIRNHESTRGKNKKASCSDSWLGVLFFCKLLPLFWKGHKNNLELDDIGCIAKADLAKPLGEDLERNWFKEINKAKQEGRKPKLWRALFWTFVWGYMIDGVFLFLQMIFCKPFQPVMLALLVSHFAPNGPTRELACYYAGGLVGISLISVIIQHNCVLRQMQRGMRLRVACCSLLYRKMLRMSNASLGQTTAGQVINLMSNDVSRFDTVLIWLHYLWIMPFQIALMCYLIYTQVDMAAVIGVMVIMAQTLPVQSYLSRLSSKFRLKIAQRTDERVRLMNEIISGIQVIKMYAWEKPFEKVVEAARIYELKAVMNASYLRGVYMSFMVFTERASLYITLLAYSLMGNPISAAAVFSLAQFYNRLQETLAFHYPNAVILGAECLVTIKRIEEFLMLPEREDILDYSGQGNLGFETDIAKTDNSSIITYNPVNLSDKPAITLEDVEASWTGHSPTLRNLTVEIPRGKLCAVIGSVGAGKSSLLQLLLKELPVKNGKMKINGSISYASQVPWLFVATVRNNILFGQPYDHDRYKQVVKVCALESDFQQFPRGDQTLVGERGVSLSGGQRARINLARAVYRQADIYLLDDPLSAVDAPVGRHLFEKCMKMYMSDTTRVLVTHQLHYLKAADIIIVLKDGKLENMGTYSELASSQKQFAELLAALEEGPHEEDDKHHGHTHTVMVTAKEHEHDQFEAEQEIEEDSGSGRVSASLYWSYWMAGKNNCLFAFMIVAMVFGQLTATLSDYFVTFWSNEQTKIDLAYWDSPADIGILYPSKPIQVEHQVRNHTMKKEFSIWDSVGPMTTVEYLYIYTIIIFCCIFFVTGRALVFFKCCMKSSKGLHDAMFHSMLKGTMRFFDTNSSGRILNRFSKDIGAVDELLPRAYMDVLQVWLVFLSIICLVSATNPWLLMPIAFIILVFYLSLQLYLNTAQDIKRLESVYRSPVYSHLTASLNGIVTIRASNSQKRLLMEFDQHQDSHSIAWYQYLACSCTLGFWLDIICVLFLTCVTFSFIFFNDGNVSAGNVGLAISQTMILMGMLQFGVRQIAEVVAQMTSVERVLQYTNIPEEETIAFPDVEVNSWPSKGEIKFENVKLFYSPNDPPVLNDLNFIIESGWKVGIVGRTGAGKSSLIAALFRLAPLNGEISIDGIPTASLPLHEVRSKISIIPQEPVLFSASLRYNLDPLNKYSDSELWNALEAVELKDVITSLDYHVCEGGSNFSIGQRQLICLARAILKNNKILVLDEATANVDPETDSFIQQTIRERFSQCTVLTIAHRLNTVMDSDRVLVMDKGKNVEYGHPYNLLKNKDGYFYKMVKETGNMAGPLMYIARNAYESNVLGLNKNECTRL